jgi:hypothetical protein
MKTIVFFALRFAFRAFVRIVRSIDACYIAKAVVVSAWHQGARAGAVQMYMRVWNVAQWLRGAKIEDCRRPVQGQDRMGVSRRTCVGGARIPVFRTQTRGLFGVCAGRARLIL